ncbi:MAG: GIY-YIG nuclease family protein [Patescibacteria group bacterium]
MTYERQYYVYIMANRYNTALYVGFTSDLPVRVFHHKQKVVPGHTGRYNLNKLVYYEIGYDVMSTIAREKQIKRWSHQKKRTHVTSMNSKWKDLSDAFL